MHDTLVRAVNAPRAARKWAFKLPLLSRAAKHLFILTAALLSASLMASPGALAEKEWLSEHYRDHPLAGTIWSSDFKRVTKDELDTAVLEANFVLLGEIHDNADHHRLQAEMIDVLVKNGRRPAIVFEMIPTGLQDELDRYLGSGSKDAGKLGEVLRWQERGWPDWRIYQPIAEVALSADLRLVGGALDREVSRAISKSDPAQAKLILDLGLDQPVKREIVEALTREIAEGHCNMLPETAIKPMIMVQRARDAYLAKSAQVAAQSGGAVLIAGSGHVRKDWAVPSFIRTKMPDAAILSVALFEVDPERPSPSDYVEALAGLEAPYDFIYFTPKSDLTDHCAEMAKHMEKMKK